LSKLKKKGVNEIEDLLFLRVSKRAVKDKLTPFLEQAESGRMYEYFEQQLN
jgi:hypothetical protein